MADNNPNLPGGPVPPRPSDSKVLPKKETVRINLPPKPSAAPTIKLPTLPPGGPSIPGSAPMAPKSAAQAAGAPRATAAPASSAPTAQRPAAQQPRPAARPAAAPAISGVDKALAIAAAVTALVAIGSTVYLAFFIDYTPH